MFLGLFAFILLLYSFRLYKLQIIDTKGNTDNTQVYSTITTVRAARGDILDRNGNVLVGNRASYNLVFNHYVTKSNPNCNQALYTLVQKCRELGITYSDHFPVSTSRPFVYTLTDFTTTWQNYFQLFMVDRVLDSDITAPLLVEKMRERYAIPTSWSDEDARAVIGFRYEFDLRGITKLPTYTFLEDVTDQQLSAILELNTPGLNVEASTVREYHTKYAAHILGYLGGMNDSQWEEYQDQGYSMDAKVGQTGFELAFEEYLHGIDGTRYDEVNKDGATTKSYYTKEPVAGNSVETTIDIKIQEVAEKALDSVMTKIKDPEQNTSTTIESYWTGMRKVITQMGGTATAYFGGPKDLYGEGDGVWPLKDEVLVYAKTGTAQHASLGSDHGAFICFAQKKDAAAPDIAIALYGEKVAHGSWLAPVAEQILLSYYEMDAASEVTAFENQAG